MLELLRLSFLIFPESCRVPEKRARTQKSFELKSRCIEVKENRTAASEVLEVRNITVRAGNVCPSTDEMQLPPFQSGPFKVAEGFDENIVFFVVVAGKNRPIVRMRLCLPSRRRFGLVSIGG